MGDIDGGNADLMLNLLDDIAHLHPKLCVKIGEGLIHQEHLRLNDDGSGQGNALLLAAGELRGHPVGVLVNPDQLEDFIRPFVPFRFWNAAGFKAVGHIIPDAHMREDRIVLENHAHVPLVCRDFVDNFIINANFTGLDGIESDDHPKQGCLSAAGWPQQGKEFAGPDFGGEPLDDDVFSVGLGDIVNMNSNTHSIPLT